ncbi:hypothetical protein FCM35_KLT02178 [Carex littledalei]|uniref:Uncharacterized protein n=1 Tax=Carex littledalei TaxID=544730 RepID=A0A833RAB9_9POAL|nr:hypothetical protein FCM35_KLT02178 [Carex littledalei]
MAPSLATINGVPLLLLSILLPLRFLQLSLRFFFSHRSSSDHRLVHRHGTPMRSLLVLVSAAALVVSIYAFSDPVASPDRGAEAVSKVEEMRHEMEREIQALKDHVFQLESSLVENTKKLDVKTELLEEDDKLIEAMERDIQHLIDEQENIKSSLSTRYHQDGNKDMEQEVKLLKDQSTKVNSNIYHLELSAKDTAKKLETLNSEIIKIQSIISEQWIQIRQLEQAFQQTKIMASRVRRKTLHSIPFGKLAYLKVVRFIEVIRLQLIHDITVLESFLLGPLGSYLSDASDHLLRFSQVAQERFHEVLQFIRRIRLRHVSDVTVQDSFFMGCSISRPCLPHVYNHFRTIKSVAQKFHHEVYELVNRIIDLI